MNPLAKLTIILTFHLFALPGLFAQQSAPPPSPSNNASPAAIQKTIEAYLRNLYAFGPDIKVTVGTPKPSELPGLLQTSIDVKIGENVQSVTFYVSKDGKYLVRGELSDLTKDPNAENRAKLDLKNAPSFGDPNAPITMVEFSDFECPVCRSLHDVLRGMLVNYPQVRLVFKDFAIEQVHPWARSAAIAGRCAYDQDPKAFWKLYDLIYDNQDVISAENSYAKLTDYASQISLNADTFKSCMASPAAAAAVDASRANALALDVNSTPTLFINGRRVVGPDSHILEQNLQYELAHQKPANR